MKLLHICILNGKIWITLLAFRTGHVACVEEIPSRYASSSYLRHYYNSLYLVALISFLQVTVLGEYAMSKYVIGYNSSWKAILIVGILFLSFSENSFSLADGNIGEWWTIIYILLYLYKVISLTQIIVNSMKEIKLRYSTSINVKINTR